MDLKKNVLSILTILFISFSINTASAFDEVLDYDFSGLGNMSTGLGFPYNLFDFTMDYDGHIALTFEGYECDNYNDFNVYIDGTVLNIPCSGGYSAGTFIEIGNAALSAGTYEVMVMENVNDLFGINQLRVLIDYQAASSGVYYDQEYKKIGFFETEADVYDFFLELAIVYMLLVALMFVYYVVMLLFSLF